MSKVQLMAMRQVVPELSDTARREIRKLDLICEELCVRWNEIGGIAAEVVGRKISNVRELSVHEIRDVVAYMKGNRSRLFEKYRRMRWNGRPKI